MDGEMTDARKQQMLIGNNSSNEQYDPVHSQQQSINNLNSQSLQQHQKKRRSAAERRASHRRRSSQNEIQLAQKKLQRKNSDQDQQEEEQQEHGNLPAAFSPIPEPPEPAIPAPGGEEDEIEDAFINVLGEELDQNWAITTDENGNDGGGMDEELASHLMRKECLRSPETVILNNSSNHNNFAAFTPSHQRSISDHLVHSAQSIRRRQRELSPSAGQKTIQKPPFSPGPHQNAELPNPRKTTLPEQQMHNESTGHLPKHFLYEEYSPAESGRDSSPSTARETSSILANIAKGPDHQNQINFEHCLGPNTSTSGILQLVSKFSTYRQHSADFTPNKKVEGPARRSFKLKSFWERRGTENDCGNNGKSHKLCPLPEDVETATDSSVQQKKRHSAILNDENHQQRKAEIGSSSIRLRTTSNIENAMALQPRPFSIIGTQDELAKYRVADEEWTHFQRFVQEKAAGEEKLPGKEEWDDSLDFLEDQPPAQPPPRMARRAPISPINSHSTQTLGRKQKLQRAATSNRADHNNIYVPSLTLPRKKPKVPAQQRRKPVQIVSHSAARRKSIVNIKELAEIAAILANEQKQQSEQSQQQIVVEKLMKRATGNKSSLKQLLGAAAGGERNRAKVAPKIAISANGDKMDMANLVVERTEKDRKRENKTNSMILGTIWSIRQRRKKDGGTPRALTNLWGTAGHGMVAEKEKCGGKAPTENDIPKKLMKKSVTPSPLILHQSDPLLDEIAQLVEKLSQQPSSPMPTTMDKSSKTSNTSRCIQTPLGLTRPDLRRPSLPASILALEMLRSSENSPTEPGTCTSLIKTLRGNPSGHLCLGSVPERRSPSPRNRNKFIQNKKKAANCNCTKAVPTKIQQQQKPTRMQISASASDLRIKSEENDGEENIPKRAGSQKMTANKADDSEGIVVGGTIGPKRRCKQQSVESQNLSVLRQMAKMWRKNKVAEYPPPPPASRRRFSLAPRLEATQIFGDFIGRPPNTMDKSATLQSPLSPLLASQSPFNTSMDEFSANSSTASLFPPLQLIQPKWEDLDLWADQPANWATKFGEQAAGLGEKALKRQNVIYELVLTERHHCQVLVLLQCYRESLLHAQLLTNDQLKILIPDVLNALLDFHLALIRRLLEKCSLQPIVDEIGDILLDEFEFGQHRSEAIQAYTTFCLAREKSIRHFGHLMSEGSSKQFRRFMEFHESEHNKDRSFKDCLLLIAQRLTKYPVLVEQMAKLESRTEQRELVQKAHAAVRKFAMQIDQQLLRHENARQWNELKKVLDKSGSSKIIHPKEGKEFTMEDLAGPLENRTRQLELFTKVFWRETMNGPEMELRLLLCDDLILFLRPKGSSSSSTNGNNKLPPLQFFRHSEHAGVFPLQSTLIKGKNTRRKSILLIQTAKQRPDLFELAFPTCNELEQCVQAIQKAKATAPKFIRLNGEKFLPLDDGPIREGHLEMKKADEAEFLAKMDEWLREMDKLFEQRMNRETELVNYFEGRMEFMEQIQLGLKRIPRRNNDDQKTLKLIEHLRNRFMELERTRTTSLNRLVERARRVKDANLFAIFDDLYDLGAGTEDEQQQMGAAIDSGSDEPRGSDSSEERRRIPRRVRTYHGTADHRKKGDSGSSTGSGAGSSAGGIRRHTTVPGRRSQMGGSSEEEEQQQREKDGKAARLLLRMEPPQRREEAAQLIRENVLMRSELNRLKAKAALQEIHLTAMRVKRTNEEIGTKKLNEESEEGDEAVRQAVMEQMMEEMARKKADLERREAELKAKEQQLMAMATNSAAEPANSFHHKEHRRDNVASSEIGHPESSCQQQQIRNGQQQNSIKISNTYCGAGPVPNTRSVENSPAHLATDRRAISQTELPLYLAVKTKQRRK